MPTQELEFQCPQCRGGSLCEVSTAMNYAWASNFYRYDSSSMWYADYYDGDTEIMDMLRIECAECGFEVCEGYPYPNLGQYLIDKGWIVSASEEEETEEPAWEI